MPFGLIVFLLLVAFFIWGVRQQSKRAGTVWNEVSRLLDLQMSRASLGGRPRMSGRFRGYGVSVSQVNLRVKDEVRVYTRYRLNLSRSLGLGLRLLRESRVSRMLGLRDISLGHTRFDSNVFVEGSDAAAIQEFLTPARRLHIMRFLNHPRSQVSDHALQRDVSGVVANRRRIRSTLGVMADLADALLHDGDLPLSEAVAAGREGDLNVALERLRARTAPPQSEDPEARLLEGGVLFTGRRFEEAAGVLDKLGTEVPDLPDVAGWRREAVRRATGDDPPPLPDEVREPQETEPPPVAPVPASTSPSPTVGSEPDLGTLCEALFGEKVSSFEAPRIFEESYEGREVTWPGRLREVTPISYDLVFGKSDGHKAVFTLREVSHSLYGERSVQAIVHLPGEAGRDLRSRKGENLIFHGRLVRCDPFMRNLFLDDGQLLDTA